MVDIQGGLPPPSPVTTPYAVPTRLRSLTATRFAVGEAWLVVAAFTAAATGLPAVVSLLLVAGVAVVAARGLATGWRLALAVVGWAIWTGFLENAWGVLTLSSTDLLRLAVLAVLGIATAGSHRRRLWDTLAA